MDDYKRGQIYFIFKDMVSEVERNSNITSGARPYLIISNNYDNLGLEFVIMLACSKRSNNGNFYTDVHYKSVDGEDAVVLCNQVRMVPKYILKNHSKYIERLPNNIMKDVEDKFLKVIGINPEVSSKEEINRNTFNITRSAINMMLDELETRFTTNDNAKNTNKKWDLESKSKFCKLYENNGIRETARVYNLSYSTVTQYYSKFTKEI